MIQCYTLTICTIHLLPTTYALCYHVQLCDPLIQLEKDFRWIHYFYFHWRLEIDEISIGPILLTGFINTLATLEDRPVTQDSRLFHSPMLALYVYASSRNIIKNGSLWIGSDQYGILTPRSFDIFSLVDNNRYSSNNPCCFNISWPTQFKKRE